MGHISPIVSEKWPTLPSRFYYILLALLLKQSVLHGGHELTQVFDHTLHRAPIAPRESPGYIYVRGTPRLAYNNERKLYK